MMLDAPAYRMEGHEVMTRARGSQSGGTGG